MAKKNAIEQEVEKVETQWEEFVETGIPILRWLLTPGSNQLVSTFILTQENCDDSVADFFVPLYSPLKNAGDFGFNLVDELEQKMQEAAKSIDDEGQLSVDWPALDRTSNALETLTLAAGSILDAFGEGFEYLVLVLRPSKVSSGRDWRSWCEGLAQIAINPNYWPKNLRIVLLDDENYPVLDTVSEDNPQAIATRIPPVDLKGAMNAIFDEADDGSPGAAYRKQMVALHHAAEENDIPLVESSTESAMKIAGAHQWYGLWVSALFVRAGVYVANERVEDGIYDYQTAQRYAKMGYEQGEEGCGKHQIFALLSEASAWIALKKWADATGVYQRSAALSEELEEHFFHMDSWRMVSFCQEQQNLRGEAWKSGQKALQAAESLEPDQREASTLPYVGESQTRLAPSEQDRRTVEQKMVEFLGEDWRSMLAPVEEVEAC